MGDYLRNVALRLAAAPSLRPRVLSRFELPGAFGFGLSRAHTDWETESESVLPSRIRSANSFPERIEIPAPIPPGRLRIDRPDPMPHEGRDNVRGSQPAEEPARIISMVERTIVREPQEPHRWGDTARSRFAHPDGHPRLSVDRSEGEIADDAQRIVRDARPAREEAASVRRAAAELAQPRSSVATPHLDPSPVRPMHPAAATAAKSTGPGDHGGHFTLTRPAQQQPEAPRADAARHVQVVIGKVTVHATLPPPPVSPAPRPAASPPSRMTLERYLELRGGRG